MEQKRRTVCTKMFIVTHTIKILEITQLSISSKIIKWSMLQSFKIGNYDGHKRNMVKNAYGLMQSKKVGKQALPTI